MVHLGPGWYLDEKKFAVKVGDTMEATGSKVTLNNQPALIAREVKVQGATLQLRDDQGLPVWRGTGRGDGGRSRRRPGQRPGRHVRHAPAARRGQVYAMLCRNRRSFGLAPLPPAGPEG